MRGSWIWIVLVTVIQLTASQQTVDTGCFISVYGAKNVSLTEYRFTWQVLFGQVHHECGCRLVLESRDDAPAAIKALARSSQPCIVLIAARGLQEDEAAAIHEAGSAARAKLVVIHQSDERNNHTVSWYPEVRAVLRNYHRDKDTLQQHLQYILSGVDRPTRVVAQLQQGIRTLGPARTRSQHVSTSSTRHHPQLHQRRLHVATEPDLVATDSDADGSISSNAYSSSNVYWIPLGYGEQFVPTPVMLRPTSVRPLVWSWTGSWGAKKERVDMIKVLNTTEMLQHGVLHTFQHFKAPQQLTQVRYSTYLYESKLVPLPPGIHPEQFRIYEVLAAGAIPVILKTHQEAGMAHVQLLQFKALWLDSWADAPQLFQQAVSNTSFLHELDSWQQHNNMQFARFLRVLKQKVAQIICSST